MTDQLDQNEAERIEKLAREAELLVEQDETKRELKEKRGILKQTLYDGSTKLKHTLPKGKRL